jgi:hypothetical protein
MTETNLILPFIAGAVDQKEDLSYQAEIACVAFLAESQIKRARFLRDKTEKIAFITKIYYPFWIAPIGNECIIIDGLKNTTHEFVFQEPTKTTAFIEELKKNSVSPQNFIETLQAQTEVAKNFTSKVQCTFPSLLADSDLLSFFVENLKNDTFRSEKSEERAQIPADTDWKIAAITKRALVNCLRTIQADAKGLKYALAIVREQTDYHRNALTNEIAVLKEKCQQEIAALKPKIDKNLKRLIQKRDTTLAALQKVIDRKMATLDKKHEKLMRRLQTVEQRKDAAQQRVNKAKKRSSSAGVFSLKKYEKDIDKTRKEIKAISDEIEELKREANSKQRLKEEEFQENIAQEESKLTQISGFYTAKTNAKQKLFDYMVRQTADINTSLESQIDELKRDGNALRSQVTIDWKTETTDELILAQIPVYLVKHTRSEEERLSLISPLTITEETRVLNELKKLLTLNPEPRLKTILQTANKKLDETLITNVLERSKRDAEFKIRVNEICRVNNLVEQNSFAATLNEGLDEIEKRGWMTPQEAQTTCKRIIGEEA